MIICGNCGTRNEDGTAFCGECGEFLEWTGTKTAVASTGDATQTTTPTSGPAPQPSTVERPAGTPTPTPTPVTTGTAATTATDPVATATTPSGTVPAVQQPPSGTPKAVQPGEEFTPTFRRHDDDEPNEGDLICGKCGTANQPTRKFCRRCGNELATAEVVEAHLSWWRRLLNWLRGRRKRYDAGDRRKIRQPRGRGRGILLISLVLAAILVLIALVPARPLVNKAVTYVGDRLSSHVPVTPISERASSTAKGHPAGLIADGVANKYWAPVGTPKKGNAWVEADFAQSMRLLTVIVTPGISKDEKDKFLTEGRPQDMTVTVSGAVGPATTIKIHLRDEPGGQTFSIGVSEVSKVRFTIDTTYGMPPGKLCAIGEIEFYARG